MGERIFICYRRDDVAGDARGIRDRLALKFGKSAIFMDVDNLLAGQRFDRELDKSLAQCDIFIAVIGPRWMEQMTERMGAQARDYVREEIAAALNCGIVVIPTLVGQGGRMPSLPAPNDLPPDIRDLVLHQSVKIAHETFGRDADGLIADILQTRRVQRRSARSWKTIAAAAGVVVVVVVAVVGVFLTPAGPRMVSMVRDWQAGHPQDDRPQPQPKTDQDVQRQPAAAAATDPALAVSPGSSQSFRDRLADGAPCSFCPELVLAPAGEFIMGSPKKGENGAQQSEDERTEFEGPQHRVVFSRPFAAGKFAVTFDEWNACVDDNGCNLYRPSDERWGRGRRPVINVSWNDANAYAAWLSRKTGKTYRLLSDAEREYVTRAGTTTPFWFGASISTEQANYDGRSTYGRGQKGTYRAQTLPVDAFAPNPWGLYQVHGNVWEWTQDCWHDNYRGNPPADGSAWDGGDQSACDRVVRGGSWNVVARDLRSANRVRITRADRSTGMGFRVARTLGP